MIIQVIHYRLIQSESAIVVFHDSPCSILRKSAKSAVIKVFMDLLKRQLLKRNVKRVFQPIHDGLKRASLPCLKILMQAKLVILAACVIWLFKDVVVRQYVFSVHFLNPYAVNPLK